jgi:transposase
MDSTTELLLLPEVAKRCDVSINTARAWTRGIRVGSKRVRLACMVAGTQCKVTPAQLETFLSECQIAKFGTTAEPAQETPTQYKARAARDKRELAELLRRS